MVRTLYRRTLASLATLCAISLSAASTAPLQDALVQAPSIGTPQRGVEPLSPLTK